MGVDKHAAHAFPIVPPRMSMMLRADVDEHGCERRDEQQPINRDQLHHWTLVQGDLVQGDFVCPSASSTALRPIACASIASFTALWPITRARRLVFNASTRNTTIKTTEIRAIALPHNSGLIFRGGGSMVG